MLRRTAVIVFSVLLAFLVLSFSILRAASIQYSFLPFNPQTLASDDTNMNINYSLPYPGEIEPDNPLWLAKVVRDRLWVIATPDPAKKAELYLLFSDKRLSAAKILFEKGKADLAYSVLDKAEKYLELAVKTEETNREAGMDSKDFLLKLANSSLKHREVLGEIIEIAPEDARPEIIKMESYSKNSYKSARDALNSLGMPPPQNPFNGD